MPLDQPGPGHNNPPPDPPRPDELVAEWNSIKAWLTAESKRFAEHCAPHCKRQEEIENLLHAFLHDNKLNNIKTEHGTAYKSVLTQPKIVNRTAFLDYCLLYWDDEGNELLQIGAPQIAAFEAHIERRKKELEDYATSHGGALPPDTSITPPGTSVGYFERVNIRKT